MSTRPVRELGGQRSGEITRIPSSASEVEEAGGVCFVETSVNTGWKRKSKSGDEENCVCERLHFTRGAFLCVDIGKN